MKNKSNAAQILRKKKEIIVKQWEEQVRKKIFAAQVERHPLLIDTTPLFIDHLIEALNPQTKKFNAVECTTLSLEHGNQRAKESIYNIANVIQEIQIMRDIILEVLESEIELTKVERSIIIQSMDAHIMESSEGFLQAYEDLREQFILVLTHDLRTPLTSIRANSQMILRYSKDCEKHLIHASRILESVNRMEKMTRDLLDANLVRSGKGLKINLTQFSFNEMAERVLEEMETIYGDRFILKADEDVRAFADLEGIRRILENLLNNAIKYGDHTTPISVKITQYQGRVILSVHNFGNPIDKEDQVNLFKQYYRVSREKRSNSKGWGLGLTLVKGLADAHKGSIIIESTREKGTTFTLDLPCDPRPEIYEDMVIKE